MRARQPDPSRLLRVLALVPYPLGRVPGQRYRMEQWAALLARDGIEVRFAPFLTPPDLDILYCRGYWMRKVRAMAFGYVRRAREAMAAGEYDVAYVYREAALLGPAWLEALHARRRPLVFDFDDAIFHRTASEANAWVAWLKFPGKVASVCRRAAHVMVGNETLADFARQHARHVTVVPSTVDLERYTVQSRGVGTRRPVIGWTGSQTTWPHLKALAPALQRLRRQVDYELRVIGGELVLEGVDVRCLPWGAASEVEDLRGIDVGVMPLPDDTWSRGKCGMKAIQYMALGIPPVVSPVGFNARLVTDGVDGLHATTEDEWVEALSRLLRDEALRQRLGATARRTVEATYTAQVQAPRVAALLRAAAGR